MALNEATLLNRVLDEALMENERLIALRLLKQNTGLDRNGLVERYAKRDCHIEDGILSGLESVVLEMRLRSTQERLDAANVQLKSLRDELRASKTLNFPNFLALTVGKCCIYTIILLTTPIYVLGGVIVLTWMATWLISIFETAHPSLVRQTVKINQTRKQPHTG